MCVVHVCLLKVSRADLDAYSLLSQQRTAAAQAAGAFADEIAPMSVTQKLVDKETKAVSCVPLPPTATLSHARPPHLKSRCTQPLHR